MKWLRPHSFVCYSKEYFLKPLLKTKSDPKKQEEYNKRKECIWWERNAWKKTHQKKYGPRVRAGTETKNYGYNF